MLFHQIHNMKLRMQTRAISPNTSRSISTL